MPLGRKEAERSLELLWEFMSKEEDPKQRSAYEKAIQSLHVYLTDVLPASQPCVRAKVKDGFVEIPRKEDEPVKLVEIFCSKEEKLGVSLDSVNVVSQNGEWGGGEGLSPIVIALVKPSSVAAHDGKLHRGDQVLEINGHSLAHVSLERARWLLDSAERSEKICLAIIPSGLVEGLKHSVSRSNLLAIDPVPRSKSVELLRKGVRTAGHVNGEATMAEIHEADHVRKSGSEYPISTKASGYGPEGGARISSRRSLHDHPLFAPSVGSRGSNQSLVSSTVEMAAHLARTSMRSSRGRHGVVLKRRKVRKMHVMKGTSGLGLRIVGGKGSKYGDMGIYISRIEEGGAAYKDGRLKPSDELLMVDGKSLVGLTHEEAVAILTTTQQLVQLVVATEVAEGQSINTSLQSIPERITAHSSLFSQQSPRTRRALVSHLSAPPKASQSVMDVIDQVGSLSPSQMKLVSSELSLSQTREDFTGDGVKKWGNLENLALLRAGGSPGGKEAMLTGGKEAMLTAVVEMKGTTAGADKEDTPSGVAMAETTSLGLTAPERELMKDGPSKTPLIEASEKLQVVQTVTQWGRLSPANIRDRPTTPEPEKKVLVFIKSEGKSLGFTICGGKGSRRGDIGIYVRSIKEGSITDQDGRLRVGDELLEVNGKSFEGCSHKKAASIIRGLKTNVVTVSVRSGTGELILPFHLYPSIPGDVTMVTLAKESGGDLGFEVIGVQFTDCSQLGVFVKTILPGSPAALCGMLFRCDQILEVNETNLMNVPIKQAKLVFASLKPGGVQIKVVHPQDLETIEAAICCHEEEGSREEYVKTTLREGSPGMKEDGRKTPSMDEDEQDLSSSSPSSQDKKVNEFPPAVKNGSSSSSDEESNMRLTDTDEDELESNPGPKGASNELASLSMEEKKEQALAVLKRMTREVTQARRVEEEDETSDESSEEEGEDVPPELPASPPPPAAEFEATKPVMAANPLVTIKPVSASSKESILESTDEDEFASSKPRVVVQQSLPSTNKGEKPDSEILITGSVSGNKTQSAESEEFPTDPGDGSDTKTEEFVHPPLPPHPASPPPEDDFPSILSLMIQRPETGSEAIVEGLQIPPGFIQVDLQLKKRARSGLGVTVVASSGVSSSATKGLFMVRRIMAGGVAAKDGRLRPGDRLVRVNGKLLSSLSHSAVLQAINDAPKDCHMVVWRDPEYDIDATSSIYSVSSRTSIFSDEEEGTEDSGWTPIQKRHSIPSIIGRDPLSLLRRDSRGSSPLVSARFSTSVMDQFVAPGGRTSSPGIAKRWSIDMMTRTGPAGESLSPPNSKVDQRQFSPPLLTPSPPSATPLVTPLPSPTTTATSPSPEPPQTEDDAGTVRDSGSEGGLSTPPPPELPSSPPPPPPAPPSTLQRGLPPTLLQGEELMALEESEKEEDEPDGAPPLPPTTPPPPPPPDQEDEIKVAVADVPKEATKEDVDAMTTTNEAGIRPKSMSGVPKGERVDIGPFEIEITKGLFGLGLTVGTNEAGMVIVRTLTSRSPISKNGNIKVGDILLSVNDISLTKETPETTMAILKGFPRGPVKFVAMAPPRDVTGKGLPTSVVTTIGKSASDRELIATEGIVKAFVPCNREQPIGIEIEGGSDTPLKYTYIKSLAPNSPAWNLGKFREGDQLVMVGDECLIGLTTAEARKVLERADGNVEIVAQRKESPRQTPTGTPMASTGEMHSPFRSLGVRSRSGSATSMGSGGKRSRSGSLDAGSTSYLGISLDASYSQNMSQQGSEIEIKEYLALQEKKAALVPEETYTIELKKTSKQKLGLAVVGGIDNPNLKEVHVRQVLNGGVAQKDGRLKRGDRIVSVNGQTLAGLDNKGALLVLRDAGAGDTVTLVVCRKLGRRTSLPPTPMPGSTRQSRRSSGEQTKAGSGTGSQNESKGSSPPRARAGTTRSRRISCTDSDDRTTFAPNTMPRRLSSMVGVKVVELRKGPIGLGIQLMGGKDTADPVTVKVVFPAGPAHKSGKIHPGDTILEANGVSFEDLTHDEAIKTMKSFPQGKISLLMRDRMAVMANALASCAPPTSSSSLNQP